MRSSVRAYLDDYDTITVAVSRSFLDGESDRFYLVDDGQLQQLTVQGCTEGSGERVYRLRLDEPLTIGRPYQVMAANAFMVPLQYRFIVKTERFSDEFSYPGDDLGSRIGAGQTSFALWAPTAEEVKLLLKTGGKEYTIDMKRTARGVFRAAFKGELEGARYTYLVHVNGRWQTSLDPYGKASTANSGESVVTAEALRQNAAVPVGPGEPVIYEISVRDASEEGTFAAMGPRLAQIKALGATVVQLMPVTDFGSVDERHPRLYYNWGYDPVQWQALEGSYSSNVEDPCQVIRDLEQLVDEAHRLGLKIVLDVVFNHVHVVKTSSLSRTVPYYYFRYDDAGKLSDGSGCGNDVDSARPMARKLIIDSLVYLTERFDVDGFRFDLMGMLDLDTMAQAQQKLRQIKPEILLYGEGWNMPTALADDRKCDKENYARIPDIGYFNDEFRDTIKGSTFYPQAAGYGTGDLTMVWQAAEMMKGQRFGEPSRSINYVECHDNMTSYDKLRVCCQGEGEQGIRRRVKLLLAFVLLSQGVPFLHAGQEYCRSKQFLTNTYNAPDAINKLKDSDRTEHRDIVEYARQLIELRRTSGLVKDGEGVYRDITTAQRDGILEMRIENCRGHQLTLVFNPSDQPFSYVLDQPQQWIFDDQGAKQEAVSQSVTIAPVSAAVFRREAK